MGKVIIATGNYCRTGYSLRNTKLNIHSIEELCYYIMKNPELCEDYLYDEGLARYIREQLGLKERGSLLADLIERDAPLKDLITVCFCSCDYFVKEEIEEFIKEHSKVERSEEWVKVKSKADSYLLQENYRDAILNYRLLIKEKEMNGITRETLGDIYHNLAIAILHTDGFSDAVDYFREAYERNNREESLKQYLLALRFAGEKDMYRSALDIYQVDDSVKEWLDAAYVQTEIETKEISEFEELNQLHQLLSDGRKEEFYFLAGKMAEKRKKRYRDYRE